MKKIKDKQKRIRKNNFFCFLLGLILAGTVSVAASAVFPSNNVTYDNRASGLKSIDVQSAIDELYNTCFPTQPPTAGNTILENVDIVTSGDGLYKDEYEDRYFYRGKSPNNYITFNNEIWRIISIENDGTIKIIVNRGVVSQFWDRGAINNWARPASLNTYLNETYLTSTLNATAQSQIVAKDWSIGPVTVDNNDLADQINDENISKWNGKVALITVSEYIRSNSNKSSCGSLSLNNANYSSCKNTSWMPNIYYSDYVTLSFNGDNSSDVFNIFPSGVVTNRGVAGSSIVIPAVYLSSKVQIVSGNGSLSDPYIIE